MVCGVHRKEKRELGRRFKGKRGRGDDDDGGDNLQMSVTFVRRKTVNAVPSGMEGSGTNVPQRLDAEVGVSSVWQWQSVRSLPQHIHDVTHVHFFRRGDAWHGI